MDDPRPLSTDKYSDSFMLHSVAPCYVYYKHQATNKNSKMLHMKTIDEIRYDNLQKLVREAGGLSELVAKAREISNKKLSRPTLDQILKRVKTTKGAVKNVGDELARKIEGALKLGRGWMDNPQDGSAAKPEASIDPYSLAELVKRYIEADEVDRNTILEFVRDVGSVDSAASHQTSVNK